MFYLFVFNNLGTYLYDELLYFCVYFFIGIKLIIILYNLFHTQTAYLFNLGRYTYFLSAITYTKLIEFWQPML